MRKNEFGLKLYIYNLSIVICIILGFLLIFIWGYHSQQVRETETNLNNIVEIKKDALYDTLELMDIVALQLSTNPDVIDMMQVAREEPNNYFETYIVDASHMYELLWSYAINSQKISAIQLFNNQGDYIGIEENLKNRNNETYIQGVELEFLNEEVNRVFVNDVARNRKDDQQGLSIIREINNTFLVNNSVIGYVEVYTNIEEFEQQLTLSNTNQIVMLYDTHTEKILGTSVDGYIENSRHTYQEVIKELNLDDSMFVVSKLPEYGISLLVLQENSLQKQTMLSMIIWVTVLFGCLVIAMALVEKNMVSSLTKPLVQLCQSIAYHGKQTAELSQMEHSGVYELDMLSTEFSSMIERLETSMEREKELGISQVKAQLYALQSQINPHFIHNTLAIIQAYALDEDYDMVIQIGEALSDLIRYGSKLTGYEVHMTDEMAQIENYMYLVKVRYEENISYEINMIDELKEQRIPGMILQPLIENCLQHGLKNKEFPWRITISCFSTQTKWYIEIEDNGVGMTKEQYQGIMQEKYRITHQEKVQLLEEGTWEIGGLTIKNIISRLYLAYGEDLEFDITTQEHVRTCIRIGGPKND